MANVSFAPVLNVHQPAWNLEDLLQHREWEAKEILWAIDRIPARFGAMRTWVGSTLRCPAPCSRRCRARSSSTACTAWWTLALMLQSA